jgi:hypothetical protein
LSKKDYLTFTFDLTCSTNVLDGLNAGIKCAGITTDVFLEMFLPTFSARFFVMKLPKPLKYTLSP